MSEGPRPTTTHDAAQVWTALLADVADGERRVVLETGDGRRVVLVSEAELDRLELAARTRSTVDVELTPREREILSRVASGCSGVAVAAQLGVATNTVAQHLVAIRRKLGVRSSAEAVVAARAAGLISPTAAPGPPAT
ncbi:LuxR family transcriptional regulator [Kineococcus gynurae]|uniref:LuxR family transcriptional regulator n=1 Tax=Kineococcus gynurae TaxID=452979 RepID=A0ABV5LRI6_9ACTN